MGPILGYCLLLLTPRARGGLAGCLALWGLKCHRPHSA